MANEPENPEVLRREILAILDKVKARGSLLYVQWLLKRITNDEPLPPIEELKGLHGAFVRVEQAFRDKSKPLTRADYDLVAKHVGTGNAQGVARALGNAVKFFRGQKKLSRLALSKRCRMPLRFILALERGQVKDISIDGLCQLADGLGVAPGVFMEKIMEIEKANG